MLGYLWQDYFPQNNRSQIKETEKNTLIMDAYNANPTSMTAAIENLKQIKHENITVILANKYKFSWNNLGENPSSTLAYRYLEPDSKTNALL